MSLFVKICGVTTQEAVEAAVASGADAVGFVFHESSPRNFHPARAAILSALLPSGVASVAVTSHPRRELVEQVLDAFAPDVWQSDAEDFDSIELPAGIERWPVYRREAPVDSLPGRLLFDSPVSGTGMRADWQCAARLALRSELVLAGGLDATNVGTSDRLGTAIRSRRVERRRALAGRERRRLDPRFHPGGATREPGSPRMNAVVAGRRASQAPGRRARRALSRRAWPLRPVRRSLRSGNPRSGPRSTGGRCCAIPACGRFPARARARAGGLGRPPDSIDVCEQR